MAITAPDWHPLAAWVGVLLISLRCGGGDSQGMEVPASGGASSTTGKTNLGGDRGGTSADTSSWAGDSSDPAGRGGVDANRGGYGSGVVTTTLGGSATGDTSKATGGASGSRVTGLGGTGISGGSLGTGGGHGGGSARDGGSGAPPERDASLDASTDGAANTPINLPGTHNPALPGVFADPNLIAFGDTFYLYPTTDGVANWGATSFSVFSSKNLVEWTPGGVILDAAKALTWAKGRAWAPGVARVGDTYYLYFSAEVQLGVATSQSPTGPFEDALGVPLVKAAQYAPQSIDPYVFIDDDNTAYLLFGSGSDGLRIAKLKADMISFANTPANISPSGAKGTLEGSGMFKRKGTYYLYWSEGDTRNASYRMAYARASSVTGPFTRLATILEQNATLGILGPGGGTILAIPSRDEHYIAYHRFKIPSGDGTNRETCIDRVAFNSDGTIVPVKPTLEGLQTAVQP